MSQLEEELKIVREIYNATLERNWGFIPISMDDLLASADDMKAFADPEMMLIAEIKVRTPAWLCRCRTSMKSLRV